MLLQLKHIYKAFYKDGYNGEPFFQTKWKTTQYDRPAEEGTKEALQEKLFEYFTHPSTFRWSLPALWGKVNLRIECEEEKRIVFYRQDTVTPVKNQKDFLKLHFQPVYDEIKIEFQSAIKENNKYNLQDLMGRNSGTFKGSGRAIRHKLMNSFRDPQKIRQLVIVQQTILEQYEYRACDLRNCIMGLVDSAITPTATDPNDKADIALIQNGFLLQLRTVLLNLLSRGSDAAALACLLLCAALREDAALILFQFMGTDYDILSLTEDTEPGRIELGNDLYLTYRTMPNYIGGYHKTDITLWKYPNTMVEKITDIFGFLFYPVQIIDVEGFRTGHHRCGPQMEFLWDISPFENKYALFEWTYQPDGWYFADSWGLGREDQEEIILYACMDKHGRFVTPFSVDKPDPNTSNSYH